MPSRSFSLNCPQPFVHQLRLENACSCTSREREVGGPSNHSFPLVIIHTHPASTLHIQKMYVWQTWQNQFWSIIIHNTTALNLIRIRLMTSTSLTSLGLHSNFASISQWRREYYLNVSTHHMHVLIWSSGHEAIAWSLWVMSVDYAWTKQHQAHRMEEPVNTSSHIQ